MYIRLIFRKDCNLTMIITLILLIYLFLCSVTDIRKRTISLPLSLLWLVFGILLTFFYIHQEPLTLILNLSTGLLLILLSVASKEAIGLGDALILIVASFFLSTYGTLYILFFALVLASIPCLILLIRHHNRKASIPFAPFISAGYIIFILL